MVTKIPKDILEKAMQYSDELSPKETFIFLKGQASQNENIIDGMYYHPLHTSERKLTKLALSFDLKDHGLIGTMHSHKKDDLSPTKEDLIMFKNFNVNIIYTSKKFKVYDSSGKEIAYEITNKQSMQKINLLKPYVLFETLKEKKEWKASFQTMIYVNAFALVLSVALLLFILR